MFAAGPSADSAGSTDGAVGGAGAGGCVSDPFGVFGEVPAVSDPATAAMLGRALAAPMGADRLRLLAKVDGRLLDAAARVDHMVAWQQCVAWASAHSELSVALVAGAPPEETGRREPSSKPTGNIAEDDRCATVSTALHSTPYSAKNRMEAARSAADEHAPVANRMLAGQWTGLHLWHARSATAGHPTGLARVAVANVCRTPGCETWTPGRLARRIRAELVRLDSQAIAKRIRRRRHQRSAHLDPTDDLHGVITVDAAWETVVWAFGVFRRWAEHERDRLRAIRKQDPAARFCCPQAMARLLTHSNHTNNSTTTSTITTTTTSSAGRGAGAGAGAGADDDTSSNPGSAGRGHAGGRGNSGGSTGRDSGANSSDGHDAGRDEADRGDADRGDGVGGDAVADPFAGVGPDDDCPFCGQPDAGVPDLAALTADAVIAAAGLLAGTIDNPATTEAGPKVGRRWGTAIVVVDLPTAFGLADNPGHVPGYGDIPAGIARELLHQAQVWRRFLIDDSGVLADTGAGTYRPSEKLRDYITMRDWTCTFPGCGRPATQADLDHIVNFNGTNTTASNLHVLCRTHHRIKTYAGWTPERQPDGTTVWTSPDGHTYTNTNDTPWTHHTTAASDNPDAAGSTGQQPTAGRATSDHADARNADARGTMGQPGDNTGHGTRSADSQSTNDGSCPRAWFDAQTLHTDHIIITFGNDDGDDTADGVTPNDPEAGPTSGTEGAPTGAPAGGTEGATDGGPAGGPAGGTDGDTPSGQASAPAGDQAGDAAQSSGGDRRGGSDHSAVRRHRGTAADGTNHKPWLDNPAEAPPTGDASVRRSGSLWPTAPYTPAEHALHNLITAHHTPPARAP